MPPEPDELEPELDPSPPLSFAPELDPEPPLEPELDASPPLSFAPELDPEPLLEPELDASPPLSFAPELDPEPLLEPELDPDPELDAVPELDPESGPASSDGVPPFSLLHPATIDPTATAPATPPISANASERKLDMNDTSDAAEYHTAPGYNGLSLRRSAPRSQAASRREPSYLVAQDVGWVERLAGQLDPGVSAQRLAPAACDADDYLCTGRPGRNGKRTTQARSPTPHLLFGTK